VSNKRALKLTIIVAIATMIVVMIDLPLSIYEAKSK